MPRIIACTLFVGLAACGGSDETLRECIPSNDAYYGVEDGCEELEICTEQAFTVNSNDKVRLDGKPVVTLEWEGGSEDCDELWCEDQVASVAKEVCQ